MLQIFSKPKLLITLGSILLFASAGFYYWFEIGCNSGGCVLGSHPVVSTLFGGLWGYLLADYIWLLVQKISQLMAKKA